MTRKKVGTAAVGISPRQRVDKEGSPAREATPKAKLDIGLVNIVSRGTEKRLKKRVSLDLQLL